MLRIEGKPLSMGRIWSQSRSGRRFLTSEGKRYKEILGLQILSKFRHLSSCNESLIFRARFHGEWRTKKGGISKTAGDLDNFNKLILDAFSEALDIDDSQVYKIDTEKIDSSSWFFEIDLIPL